MPALLAYVQYFFVPSRAPTSFVNSLAHLEITVEKCSTYFSSLEAYLARWLCLIHILLNTDL